MAWSVDPQGVEKSYWLFRGHKNEDWKLQPTIERKTSYYPIRKAESQLISDFRIHAALWSKAVPDDNDHVSWLAVMRHHGVPTRFLDWSYSPLVALHFALEDGGDIEKDAAVWSINSTLIQKRFESVARPLLNGLTIDLSDPKQFDAIAMYVFDGESHQDDGLVATIFPRLASLRSAAQQGAFLLNCNHTLPFQDSLKKMMSGIKEDQWIKKWRFPYALRAELARTLFRSNVHPLSLFPDLDGMGRLLALKYEIYPIASL